MYHIICMQNLRDMEKESPNPAILAQMWVRKYVKMRERDERTDGRTDEHNVLISLGAG